MGEDPYSLLIVDDDEATLESMTTYFTKRGFAVTAASNGLDALKVLESRTDFDAVITDIVMPDVSGIGVISVAKRRLSGVPLIAITGWGEHPEGLASEAEADRVIKKPIELAALEKIILKLLKTKRMDSSP